MVVVGHWFSSYFLIDGDFPTAGSSGQGDLIQSLTELRKKLVAAKAEQDAGKKKLIDENNKLQYQVLHLKSAVREADDKAAAAEAKLSKGSWTSIPINFE